MASIQNNTTRKVGVLPVSAHTKVHSDNDWSKSAHARSATSQDGVKAKVRWLPPGLTEEEFLNAIGDTWKPGNGRVGWFRYGAGKISKSLSKDPLPAFAFLQVKEEDLNELSLAVQNATWEDAKGSFNYSSVLGPPYVERSIYKKVSLGKQKKDSKEGTIDEDDEWKAFLASLTDTPTIKKDDAQANAEEATTTAEANTKSQVTPLVAAILEKQANKAKETANARSKKHSRQESHGGKGKGSAAATEEPKKKSKDKAEKFKETVKILKKQAATEAAAEAAKVIANETKAGGPASERPSRRPQLAKDILRRDLGIKEPETERKGMMVTNAQDDASTKAAAISSKQPAPETASAPSAPKSQTEKPWRRRRAREAKANEAKASNLDAAPAPIKPLAILPKNKEEPAVAPAPPHGTIEVPKSSASTSRLASNSAVASVVAPQPQTGSKAGCAKGSSLANDSQKKGNAALSAGASGPTRAFLKHANPSQGVTEAVLKGAMEAFGSVNSVEIDRRKGFAYVEFSHPGGLVKAMAASPIIISNASVQILERKDHAPKKAAITASSVACQLGAPKEKDKQEGPGLSTVAVPAAATVPAAPKTPAEKGNAEPPQASKRSRRRGRGKGGYGGGGSSECKSGGGSSSAQAPPAKGASVAG